MQICEFVTGWCDAHRKFPVSEWNYEENKHRSIHVPHVHVFLKFASRVPTTEELLSDSDDEFAPSYSLPYVDSGLSDAARSPSRPASPVGVCLQNLDRHEQSSASSLGLQTDSVAETSASGAADTSDTTSSCDRKRPRSETSSPPNGRSCGESAGSPSESESESSSKGGGSNDADARRLKRLRENDKRPCASPSPPVMLSFPSALPATDCAAAKSPPMLPQAPLSGLLKTTPPV